MWIFLTWTERRAWLPNYGKRVAALWCEKYSHERMDQAIKYAKQSGESYRVVCAPAAYAYEGAKQYALTH